MAITPPSRSVLVNQNIMNIPAQDNTANPNVVVLRDSDKNTCIINPKINALKIKPTHEKAFVSLKGLLNSELLLVRFQKNTIDSNRVGFKNFKNTKSISTTSMNRPQNEISNSLSVYIAQKYLFFYGRLTHLNTYFSC